MPLILSEPQVKVFGSLLVQVMGYYCLFVQSGTAGSWTGCLAYTGAAETPHAATKAVPSVLKIMLPDVQNLVNKQRSSFCPPLTYEYAGPSQSASKHTELIEGS